MQDLSFNPPLKGKEAELFGFVINCMALTNFVRPEDLQEWIKGKKGWSSEQLRISLGRLLGQGALFQFPEGLKPVTHIE